MSDIELFKEFEKLFTVEAEAMRYAPDAEATLNYRFMYQAFVFGFKAGQRKEINAQHEN